MPSKNKLNYLSDHADIMLTVSEQQICPVNLEKKHYDNMPLQYTDIFSTVKNKKPEDHWS